MKTLLTFTTSFLLVASLNATTITFDEGSVVPGEIITTQYAGVGIASISATHGTGDAIIFDSEASTTTEDWDLLRKGNGRNHNGPADTVWNGGGNLANDTILGNLLIVQDNQRQGKDNFGNYTNPDDEVGSTITFNFAAAILNFGFDFVDIESSESLKVEFFNGATSHGLFDSAVLSTLAVYGNNSINTTNLKSLTGLGVNKVVFNFSGSGAIDNVRFNVSDSGTTLALLGAGLLGLVGTRRRFSK